jgi:hypothetical protein
VTDSFICLPCLDHLTSWQKFFLPIQCMEITTSHIHNIRGSYSMSLASGRLPCCGLHLYNVVHCVKALLNAYMSAIEGTIGYSSYTRMQVCNVIAGSK